MKGMFCRLILGWMTLALSPLPAGAATGPLAPGIQLFESRQYEEARKFFEPYAARNPQSAEALLYLGRTYLSLRNYDVAIDSLEKAAKLAPRQTEVRLWLGRAYGRAAQRASVFSQMGLAKKAKAAFEEAVALDAANLEARSDLLQFYLVAPGFMGGDVDKAREQAAEIRKRDAVRGAVESATIHVHEKDFAAAERELKEAIQQTPSEPRLRLALANVYQSQQAWDKAFETLEAVLKGDPENRSALYQVGRAGAVSGQRLDRAEVCLKQYLANSPGPDEPPLANAHFRLGMVYAKKGSKAPARAEYQLALKLDPGLKDAKEALEKLD